MNLRNNNVLLVLLVILTSMFSMKASEQDTRYFDVATDATSVYIAASDGLVIYDIASGQCSKFSDNIENAVTSIAISPQSSIYVGCYKSGGVYEFNDADFEKVDLGDVYISNISTISFGDGLWVGGEYRLIHSDNNGTQTVYESPSSILAHYSFNATAFDATNNRMWFGIDSSAPLAGTQFGYISQDGSLTYIPECKTQVYDLSLPESGVVLLATRDGLMKCESEKLSQIEIPGELESEIFTKIVSNKSGFYASAGDKILAYEDGEFRTIKIDNISSEDWISSVAFDGNNLWITTMFGGLFKYSDSVIEHVATISPSGIETIHESADSEIMYDLCGRIVKNPAKGQIIIRGSKKRI